MGLRFLKSVLWGHSRLGWLCLFFSNMLECLPHLVFISLLALELMVAIHSPVYMGQASSLHSQFSHGLPKCAVSEAHLREM